MQLKGLRKLETDSRTWACNIIGWENSVAINGQHEHLPITEDVRAALPSNCWRKELKP
jgi:hypothetical protein